MVIATLISEIITISYHFHSSHLCLLGVYLFFIFLFFLRFYLFLFLAALGLRCCVQAFSSCGEQGLLFVVVRGLLIAVASPASEHGL